LAGVSLRGEKSDFKAVLAIFKKNEALKCARTNEKSGRVVDVGEIKKFLERKKCYPQLYPLTAVKG
jgi:hypothetical protein